MNHLNDILVQGLAARKTHLEQLLEAGRADTWTEYDLKQITEELKRIEEKQNEQKS